MTILNNLKYYLSDKNFWSGLVGGGDNIAANQPTPKPK